mgnify:CR=1 FL=1|tara:strand:- start:1827 stop:2168 length:342 start_codon:yes stop_codon:yes gene_type:complete
MTKNWLKPPIELRNGYKDKARLAAIHKQPCSLCFVKNLGYTTLDITAHHKHGGGMGKKSSDLLTMSLCVSHHLFGKGAFHEIGRRAWEKKWKVKQYFLIHITNRFINGELKDN